MRMATLNIMFLKIDPDLDSFDFFFSVTRDSLIAGSSASFLQCRKDHPAGCYSWYS